MNITPQEQEAMAVKKERDFWKVGAAANGALAEVMKARALNAESEVRRLLEREKVLVGALEAWREKHGDIMQSEVRFVALQGENATLRQEVEEQAGKLAEVMAERDHDRRLVKLWAEQADAAAGTEDAKPDPIDMTGCCVHCRLRPIDGRCACGPVAPAPKPSRRKK